MNKLGFLFSVVFFFAVFSSDLAVIALLVKTWTIIENNRGRAI